MPEVVKSVRAEFQRYKALAEAALEQVDDDQMFQVAFPGGNSMVTLMWHIGGNLASRFTDFLTQDGEKPWRRREEEFAHRTLDRQELMTFWSNGWACLFGALDDLRDADLEQHVTIRGVSLSVPEALHRSLAHISYHVGQIVLTGRFIVGEGWAFLSIPPGGSAAYNASPDRERASEHHHSLKRPGGGPAAS